jgi:hypothetical protein
MVLAFAGDSTINKFFAMRDRLPLFTKYFGSGWLQVYTFTITKKNVPVFS